MTWHKKYWDAVEHFYWELSHLGLASINQNRWGDDPELIQLPRSLIKKRRHDLYSSGDQQVERTAGAQLGGDAQSHF